jgi:hypothetical protein
MRHRSDNVLQWTTYETCKSRFHSAKHRPTHRRTRRQSPSAIYCVRTRSDLLDLEVSFWRICELGWWFAQFSGMRQKVDIMAVENRQVEGSLVVMTKIVRSTAHEA